MNLIDFLKTLRYPGRFVVLGQSNGAVVAVYGATGRSPASLARQYVKKGTDVYAVATDDTVKKEGNPDLLEYRTLRTLKNGFVLANGTQSDKVSGLGSVGALEGLSLALNTITYEPDAYKTPRITGCVSFLNGSADAALGIARAGGADVERMFRRIKLEEGMGHYIGTYSGDDARPAPSFIGGPIAVELDFKTAPDAAAAVYGALAPAAGEADYRVGVVAVVARAAADMDVAIYNRSSTKQ